MFCSCEGQIFILRDTITCPPMNIRLITWNVLADCYSSGALREDLEDISFISWDKRFENIKLAILDVDADFICLQEIDHFEDGYELFFDKNGYSSIYFQRPQKNDGCLISYKKEKFVLKETKLLNLDNASENIIYSMKSRYIRNNVSILAKFQGISDEKEFIVSTCHLYWNPKLPDVKLAQIRYIFHSLKEFNDSQNLPIVFCGDLNTLPQNFLYKLIVQRDVDFAQTIKSCYREADLDLDYMDHGPKTKFLAEFSLSRLTKWLRILGVSVAMESLEVNRSLFNSPNEVEIEKSRRIKEFFSKARSEKRVILTASKTLLERSECPPGVYVKPSRNPMNELAQLFKDFRLELKREKFLSICGKCGGEIEEATSDEFDLQNFDLFIPSDRQLFKCIECFQPYWWNDHADSSPAKAMKKAEELYRYIKKNEKNEEDSSEIDIQNINSTQGLSNSFFIREKYILNKAVTESQGKTEPKVPFSLNDDKSDIFKELNFRSIFSGDHISEELDDLEPKLTNWNCGFYGTLDYIFVNQKISVFGAYILPKVEMNRSTFPLELMESSYILSNKINSPQPSADWPSDHFIVCSDLQLE